MANVDGYKNIELLREYSLPEALSGMSMVGGIIKMLVNEIHAAEERTERLDLQEKLDQQKDQQIKALLEQNNRLMEALLGQQGQAPQAQAGGIDLAALLEAMLAQATPQQRQQVQHLLAEHPQAARRLALPAQAGVRRGQK